MSPPDVPYYRSDLALVHHLGSGFHADAWAPGILALLEPVLHRGVPRPCPAGWPGRASKWSCSLPGRAAPRRGGLVGNHEGG